MLKRVVSATADSPKNEPQMESRRGETLLNWQGEGVQNLIKGSSSSILHSWILFSLFNYLFIWLVLVLVF